MASPELEHVLDTEQEYRTIESTLLQTARGRWFLAEHSRRSRRLESLKLDDAIARLQSSLRDPPALLGRLRTELDQVNALLRTARAGLLAREGGATAAPSSATTSLLKAAEELHALIWSLQAREIDPVVCEQIGRQTAAIFALTARQAQESARVLKLADALDAITLRVAGILETISLEATEAAAAPPDEV